MITYELRTRRGTCRQVYDTEDRAREAKVVAEQRVGVPFDLVRVTVRREETILN